MSRVRRDNWESNKTTIAINIAIFLILNVWTNKHQQSFLKVTIYFIIDQWQFQKLILTFKSLFINHTKWEMINVVLLILIRYALDFDLLTITTNNASFNQILRSNLNNLLQQKLNVKWNYYQDIIRCMIHVMQLMLEIIFKTLKIKNDVIDEVAFSSAAIATIKIDVSSWANIIVKIIIIVDLSQFIITLRIKINSIYCWDS